MKRDEELIDFDIDFVRVMRFDRCLLLGMFFLRLRAQLAIHDSVCILHVVHGLSHDFRVIGSYRSLSTNF